MTQNALKITALFLTATISVLGYLKLQSNRLEERPEVSYPVNAKMDAHVKTDSAVAVNNDFYYHIGPRFSPISLTKIKAAKSVSDILEEDWELNPNELKNLEIQNILFERRSGIKISGNSPDFTNEQLLFLEHLEYSEHFMLSMDLLHQNDLNQQIPEHISPHYTVVPAQQAYYLEGNRNLLNHIREENRSITNGVSPEDLGTTMLYFVVGSDGKLKDFHFDQPSPLPAADAKLIDILSNLPGSWVPAENEAGEKVAQQLVLTFGMPGC